MKETKTKAPKEQEKQPMKYWLVEITLTSGEGLQFYVSAINEHEAYQKADGYSELAENELLKQCYDKMGFNLLP
tara:strand:+ start:1951 stop:2172 length:222 start_codon:yes stop_codon:yes gene_type:complete